MGDDKIIVFLDHQAPARRRGLDADAEEAQPRLDDNGGSKIGSSYYPNRAHDIRQDMAKEDPEMGVAERPGDLNKFSFPQREDLTADDPRNIDPKRQADGYKNLPEAFAQHQHDGKDQQQRRDAPDDIDQPKDDLVDAPAEISRQRAKQHSDAERYQHRHQTHGKAYADADEQPAENIPAILVG